MGGAEPLSGLMAGHDLGRQLEPALKEVCEGRLSDIRWFRTDWQRGGAATAYAKFGENGATRDVVIKIPVGPMEHRVVSTLAGRDGSPTPRIALHGTEIGGWDLAWLIMERVPGNPLAAHLHKQVFEDLAHAAAGFYKATGEAWPDRPAPPEVNWEQQLERARESLRTNHPAAEQVWAQDIKLVMKKLPKLLAVWNTREINAWCHGDLHAGNLMRRPEGSAWGPPGEVLLDFAEVHPGHWIEDAVYLERIYWAKPEALDGAKPVSLIAKARRALGLDTSDDYQMLANVRRVLMAATIPAFLKQEGHPRYLQAALDVLNRTLPLVG